MEKREYNILSCKSVQELINEINESLKYGWVPTGGVAAVGTPANPLFLQAVVRSTS
jgi:hypothetical protein